MSEIIAWIAAAEEQPKPPGLRPPLHLPWPTRADDRILQFSQHKLPAHQFPPKPASPLEAEQDSSDTGSHETANESAPTEERFDDAGTARAPEPEPVDDPLDRNPELRAYRGRTIGMVRRYLRYSLEAGRLPSILGTEFFRTRVTSYSGVTFEDRVILVHDMEICLERLSEFSRQLIARSILQEHDLVATARLLHCNEKTIRRTIPIAIDELSEILLEVGLLERLDPVRQKSCQEGETSKIPASDCKEDENKF